MGSRNDRKFDNILTNNRPKELICSYRISQGLGFVPNWQTMAVLRVLLGAFEAGFYPGCVYLLSTWYPRYELQKRNAAFFLIGNSATAFGGIMAYGLMQMDGLGGVTGWRWIFVVRCRVSPISVLGTLV